MIYEKFIKEEVTSESVKGLYETIFDGIRYLEEKYNINVKQFGEKEINELINMYKDTYYDNGSAYVEGQRIKSWKKGGHGLQTYLEVLQNSSNPGFVNIARKLGKDNLFNYIN